MESDGRSYRIRDWIWASSRTWRMNNGDYRAVALRSSAPYDFLSVIAQVAHERHSAIQERKKAEYKASLCITEDARFNGEV